MNNIYHHLSTLNSHNVGDVLSYDIQSKVPLTHYTYQVIARGDVIATKTVQLEGEGATKTTIEFELTYAMMPSAKIVVFTIRADGSVDVATNYISTTPHLTNEVTFSHVHAEMKKFII